MAKDRVGTRNSQVSFGSKRDSLWMANWITRLLKRHEWGVTMTHGITTGYDCFPDPQVLWHHLEQVASMQDRIWVATFHDIAAYTAERDTISLDIRQEPKGIISITPKMPLDEQIFCQPLTLVVDAIVSEARQGRKRLIITKKNQTTLIDFDPHGGEIELKAFLPIH